MTAHPFCRPFLCLALCLFVSVAGCANEVTDATSADFEEFSKDDDQGFFEAIPLGSKADTTGGIRGPLATTDGADTEVWATPNRWEDRDENGLDYNDKYALWIESLPRIDAESYGETFDLITPWGFQLRAPRLECAEASVFLRVTFAAWHGLPFYMTAWAEGSNLHFGHFGVWRDNARDSRFPTFGTRYPDYSDQRNTVTEATWPSDPKLAQRKLTASGDDVNEWMGEGKYAGAYFDRIFLNKRVGHFLVYVLTYTGSIHLASTQNTFNLAPQAVREGDTLLHRWQRRGIGHTMVVKTVTPIDGTDYLEAELMSGSMPRRQPKWETPASSKYSFVSKKGGGEADSSSDGPYAGLGGGIKRWRVAKVVGDRWRNVVADNDQAWFVPFQDQAAIGARPDRFEELLTEQTPELKRDTIVSRIEDRRAHLRDHPASCSARIAREESFDELYELQEQEFGQNETETDLAYRTLEDYVFAELVYEQSRTCCWNSTTRAMYDLAMALNQPHVTEGGVCNEPIVFQMVDGGYGAFEEFAEAQGQAADWVPWSADESCPQEHTVQTDTQAEYTRASYCTLFGGGN